MVKRIIFITETRFGLRDFQRFGIELLQENGFRVEVWDLSPVIHPKLLERYTIPDEFNYDGLILFYDKRQIYNKLLTLSQNDYVMNLVSYIFSHLWIYRALSKSNASYASAYANALPEPVIKKSLLHHLARGVKKLLSFRYFKAWEGLLIRLPLQYLGVKAANLLIIAGGDGPKPFNYRFPVGKDTEYLRIHTFNYDLYLKERAAPCAERPMAVFLDEFLPFHPDYIIIGFKTSISAERYYPLINIFFDLLEEQTGLEVVIAAHPRSNYENHPDYYNGRKCIRGKTANLIKDCRVVLTHGSIAIQFANLFYKPVIFMTWPDLDKTYNGFYVREFAKFFGKKPIFINGNNHIDWEKELKVDKDCYDNYRRRYIKAEKSEDLPFWQIVANRLKKGFE